MAYRNPRDQEAHDDVIRARAEYIGVDRVVTNPGQEKNFGISGLYPDVIVFEDEKSVGDEDCIVRIEEVETDVTSEEAEQWEEYADLGFPLGVIIPRIDENRAYVLVKLRGIDCNIVIYTLNNNGALIFSD